MMDFGIVQFGSDSTAKDQKPDPKKEEKKTQKEEIVKGPKGRKNVWWIDEPKYKPPHLDKPSARTNLWWRRDLKRKSLRCRKNISRSSHGAMTRRLRLSVKWGGVAPKICRIWVSKGKRVSPYPFVSSKKMITWRTSWTCLIKLTQTLSNPLKAHILRCSRAIGQHRYQQSTLTAKRSWVSPSWFNKVKSGRPITLIISCHRWDSVTSFLKGASAAPREAPQHLKLSSKPKCCIIASTSSKNKVSFSWIFGGLFVTLLAGNWRI